MNISARPWLLRGSRILLDDDGLVDPDLRREIEDLPHAFRRLIARSDGTFTTTT